MPKIQSYQNIDPEGCCLIVGTGPSLRNIDTAFLDKFVTFGIGELDLFTDQNGWVPDYFVMWDTVNFEYMKHMDFEDSTHTNHRIISTMLENGVTVFAPQTRYPSNIGINKLVKYPWHKVVIEKPSHGYISNSQVTVKDKHLDEIHPREYFSTSCHEVVNNFGGTFSVAVQIATYLGYDTVGLIGMDGYVDHNFHMVFPNAADPQNLAKHSSTLRNAIGIMDEDKPLRTLVNSIAYKLVNSMPATLFSDPNHFDPNYSPKLWVVADEKKPTTHQCIKKASDAYGFDVINLSPRPQYDVYERGDEFCGEPVRYT